MVSGRPAAGVRPAATSRYHQKEKNGDQTEHRLRLLQNGYKQGGGVANAENADREAYINRRVLKGGVGPNFLDKSATGREGRPAGV